mmetsp:Transcript_26519/g.67909  ORF Transcript_26519/g.67909 Transcript_26519/m.67909 type:complete len:161 (+) Transcript_26519:2904-3386(+)
MGHFFARSLPPRSNEMQRHRRDKKGYAIFLFRQTMSQELMSNGAFLIGCQILSAHTGHFFVNLNTGKRYPNLMHRHQNHLKSVRSFKTLSFALAAFHLGDVDRIAAPWSALTRAKLDASCFVAGSNGLREGLGTAIGPMCRHMLCCPLGCEDGIHRTPRT